MKLKDERKLYAISFACKQCRGSPTLAYTCMYASPFLYKQNTYVKFWCACFGHGGMVGSAGILGFPAVEYAGIVNSLDFGEYRLRWVEGMLRDDTHSWLTKLWGVNKKRFAIDHVSNAQLR